WFRAGCMWLLDYRGVFSHTGLKLVKLAHDSQGRNVAKSYGNIYTLWFGRYPVVVLNGFQAVKDGLTTRPEDLAGRPLSPFFHAMANNKGLLLATGSTWRHQRKFTLVTLKSLGLGKTSLEYQIQEEAGHLVENFRNAKGRPMNPSFALTLAVSNVICAVVFGHRFSNDDKTFHHLLEAMECIFKFAGSIYHQIYDVFPWLMRRLPGPHKKTLASCEEVCSFIRKEIRSHQDRGASDEPQDFIHSYLAQIEKIKDQPKPAYDERNMVQCIFDLFLGGTETSSTTLYWALLYMVVYPDIQGKVQKEIDATVGPGHMICYEDRKNLPYTNAVIHEAQRFSNVVSIGVPRLCAKDTMIQEFFIKR
ncbi:PREDICTED: cytochrome P450 2J6-like, partial [Gekko japonicus]|uniref:Cytochrome P450 2J6-like n=1 Tax=Gekko japonicus TaxID=146911 RepID=A0ABM1KUC9_GEKJA